MFGNEKKVTSDVMWSEGIGPMLLTVRRHSLFCPLDFSPSELLSPSQVVGGYLAREQRVFFSGGELVGLVHLSNANQPVSHSAVKM